MSLLPTPSFHRCRPLLLPIILFACLIIVVYTLHVQAHPAAQEVQTSVFLPLVVNDPVEANPELPWQPNVQEQELEILFLGDPDQHRTNPSRNDILSKVARARAQDMVTRNYFSHTDPDGHQPNFLVEQAGYQLPDFYPDNGNSVESIGLNYLTSAEAWQGWKNSPPHRTHVLGEDSFFRVQIDYGFGFAETSDRRYWVIITARH